MQACRTADQLLRTALAATPRRHRLPPLAGVGAGPLAAEADWALAQALEAARLALLAGSAPAEGTREQFLAALAALVRAGVAGPQPDAALQAAVLRAHDPDVAEHARLAARAVADRRELRATIDAVAHPARLPQPGHGPTADTARELHGLARSGDWPGLRAAAQRLRSQPPSPDAAALVGLGERLLAAPGLHRLERGAALRTHPAVQRYLALCGPAAGTPEAARDGRVAGARGRAAEAATAEAFEAIANVLRRRVGGALRVVRGLRTPADWPGERARAKDEWDVALLCEDAECACNLLLLAEAKASPSAVAADLPRLLRGLDQLSRAAAGTRHPFECLEGVVALRGESLQALAPVGARPPAQVVYSCLADPEPRPRVLSVASRAILWTEPASLAYADRLQRGDTPAADVLRPVWDDLLHAPRLRAVLEQGALARTAHEALVHPHDLLAALEALGPGSASPAGGVEA
ncbi:MAG TPA: hypothetical protein VFE82_09670 [Ramlibacter sp.]|jgi:hypothetical protein|uniref:hypothetical protein n=1 Tax=Ramlibacter sp. TaxID=1917967 RepID=UPI002D227BD6|nr:hypothetical protein [Ramlibacter sp.]HZY18740.1 hypothetical protein [Ramlibacter sp.]